METVSLETDIRVFYVTASSFPQGIMAAHNQLQALVPFSAERKFFGISRPEHGAIVYKAAAEELTPGEAERLNCDTMILKKGTYSCITIHNYKSDEPGISKAFEKILKLPNIDPNGYCVEWYISNNDVRCMVRVV